MPQFSISARYECEQPAEANYVHAGFASVPEGVGQETPVRWVWRVAMLPRADYEELGLELPDEKRDELIKEGLAAVYIDLPRTGRARVITELPPGTDHDTGRDADRVYMGYPTPIEVSMEGVDDDTIFYCQRVFSLN